MPQTGSRPAADDAVSVERDLTYAHADGVDLCLDLYRPTDAAFERMPLVVYLHGGGWSTGSKSDDANERVAALAAHGVVVAAVDYRLAPTAVFPAQLHDVKGALRWLRAHAETLRIDSERIGIWGASAGAYLASLAALSPGDAVLEGDVGGNVEQSSAVQAVVHWFGQTDLAASAHRTPIEAKLLPFAFEAGLLGTTDATQLALRAAGLSLPARTTASAPPFFIVHGDRDRIVPAAEGFALHQALSRAGAVSRFELLAGAGHEDEAFDSAAHLAVTAAWLRAVLR
ncbi:MAG TPA: alpha/beta hydrolase [Microbacteriaceae bacterium]|nr:alpha/beta hydrolase [Microbacteriaceae bacterium]